MNNLKFRSGYTICPLRSVPSAIFVDFSYEAYLIFLHYPNITEIALGMDLKLTIFQLLNKAFLFLWNFRRMFQKLWNAQCCANTWNSKNSSL